MMAKANGFRKDCVITNASPNTERNMIVVRLLCISESVQVVTRTFEAEQRGCSRFRDSSRRNRPRYNSESSWSNVGFRKGGHASLVSALHSHAARGPGRCRGRQPQVSPP